MDPMNFYGGAGNSRLSKARYMLSLFSQDMVEDIIALVQHRGSAVISDIFASGRSSQDPPHILGVLSRNWMNDDDVPNILLALSTILLADMRKPRRSNDDYQELLMNAFSLPKEIAEPLSKSIETADVLRSRSEDGIDWSSLDNRIADAVRRAANWIPKVLGLNWEIDQNQDYDHDYLYELSLLGEAVAKMNKRANLMAAQSAINVATGAFAMEGDIEELGDDMADAMVGDALSLLSARSVHPSVAGNLSGLINFGRKQSVHKVDKLAKAGGYNLAAKDGATIVGPAKSPALKRTWEKILKGKPGKVALLGAGAGTLAGLVSSLMKGDPSSVEEFERLTGDVVDEYGDEMAGHWLAGDIDSIVKTALNDASDDISTGDPGVDDDIERHVASITAREGDLDPEMGGLFTKWRYNAAKKKLARKHKRMVKKGKRLSMKQGIKEMKEARRNMKPAQYQSAEVDDEYRQSLRDIQPTYNPDEEQQVDDQQEQMNPDDNQQESVSFSDDLSQFEQ